MEAIFTAICTTAFILGIFGLPMIICILVDLWYGPISDIWTKYVNRKRNSHKKG
jgi:hypothetical protein